jgi:hypothetical protein
MEPTVLFDFLQTLFPTCFFTHKGKTIKAHKESVIDGFPAYNFTKFGIPYKLGVHLKLADYLERNGYEANLNSDGELIIKQE